MMLCYAHRTQTCANAWCHACLLSLLPALLLHMVLQSARHMKALTSLTLHDLLPDK
jgi:hypothetical protein